MKLKNLAKACAALSICAAVCAGTGAASAGAQTKDTQTENTQTENTQTKDTQASIDAQTFPDENFRAAVSEQADTNQDGVLSEEEIQKVKTIKIKHPHQEGHPCSSGIGCDIVFPIGIDSYDGIQIDFTGMDVFQNLNMLILHNVKPSGIPFENLGSLKQFYLSSGPAVELDFSKAPGLEIIDVTHTEITKLNLKKNTSLNRLQLRGCALEQADFSSCKNLEYLWLDYNAFKSIDLTKNTRLEDLILEHNKLTSLNLAKNDNLKNLYINFNNFKKINSSTLKVSASSSLSKIYALNLKKCTLLDVSHMDSLQKLYASSEKFNQIKIGKNLRLLDLSFGFERNSPMIVLDAQTFQAPAGAKLKELWCCQGNMEKLDLRHLKNLQILRAEDSRITEADLSGNLKMIDCSLDGNKLEKLSVSSKSSAEQKKMYRKIVKKNGGELIYK